MGHSGASIAIALGANPGEVESRLWQGLWTDDRADLVICWLQNDAAERLWPATDEAVAAVRDGLTRPTAMPPPVPMQTPDSFDRPLVTRDSPAEDRPTGNNNGGGGLSWARVVK